MKEYAKQHQWNMEYGGWVCKKCGKKTLDIELEKTCLGHKPNSSGGKMIDLEWYVGGSIFIRPLGNFWFLGHADRIEGDTLIVTHLVQVDNTGYLPNWLDGIADRNSEYHVLGEESVMFVNPKTSILPITITPWEHKLPWKSKKPTDPEISLKFWKTK